jgi:hypothetical protein
MSAANPPASGPEPRAGAEGTYWPILIAGIITALFLIGFLALKLFAPPARPAPGSAIDTLTSALRDGDVAGLQAASCDGWPSAAADLRALGTVAAPFLLDGPNTVGTGSVSATLGVWGCAAGASPVPTSSAQAHTLTADTTIDVTLSYQDNRWCVSSFTPQPAG